MFVVAVDRREKCNRRGKYNRREKYNRRDWQAWEWILKQARQQWESYKAGNLGAKSVDSRVGERIDLTIDSGCAASALPVGVASAVRIENAGAWVDSDTQISEWQCAEFEVQCHGQVAHTIGSGVQSCRCRQLDLAAAETQRGSFIEDVRSKHRKRIFERNGVYVLSPCWLVKQSPQKRLARLDASYPNDRQLRP